MKELEKEKALCTFLEMKLTLFREFLAITDRIKKTIKNKGLSKLGHLLSDRQDCIYQIDKIDRKLEKIIETSAPAPNPISKRFEGRINSILKDLKDIMETIESTNRAIMVNIKEESESLKTRLLKIHNVRQAAKSYRKNKHHLPRFLDTTR